MVQIVLSTSDLDQLERLFAIQGESVREVFDPRFLQLLASIDRGALAQAISERFCLPGELIFQEGHSGEDLYIIRSGRVAVLKGELASHTVLGFRGLGEVIGEMSLLEDQPRSASVVALDEVRLLRIGRDQFQEVLEGYPFIQRRIMELLSARLRDADVARREVYQQEKRLEGEVQSLQVEKEHLLEMEHLRKETSDFIVHDLRNPLGVVSGSLKMLEMVLPEDVLAENGELIGVALSSCERMQRLVDSLLEVSRMEAGEAEMILAEVSVGELLENAAARVAPLHKRDIVMWVQVAEGIPPVALDRERIDRVLANLIDNAIKHTPTGGRVTLSAAQVGACVQVSVMDSGAGIPAEDRQRIFDRFAQITGEKRRRRGFGLGLTYCRLAVEAHNGKIWVEQGESGLGSRFVFSLPVTPLA